TPGQYLVTFSKRGYKDRILPASLADAGIITVGLDRGGSGPLPAAPTRDELLRGQTTQQGLVVHSLVYGDMPWWGGAWAWLTPEDRAHIAPQLLEHGDTIAVIQNAMDGRPLYDESGQFYSPDKFGPLALSAGAITDL